MDKIRSLNDLLIYELKDLHSAEKQLLDLLPTLSRAADSSGLKEKLELQTEQTKNQMQRLEQIFDQMSLDAEEQPCRGMEGLVAEVRELMQQEVDPEVLDAGLIGGFQRIAHYGIAAYGSARTYAKLQGNDWAAQILQMSLDEKQRSDSAFTAFAERVANVRAR